MSPPSSSRYCALWAPRIDKVEGLAENGEGVFVRAKDKLRVLVEEPAVPLVPLVPLLRGVRGGELYGGLLRLGEVENDRLENRLFILEEAEFFVDLEPAFQLELVTLETGLLRGLADRRLNAHLPPASSGSGWRGVFFRRSREVVLKLDPPFGKVPVPPPVVEEEEPGSEGGRAIDNESG